MVLLESDKRLKLHINEVLTIELVKNPLTDQYAFLVKSRDCQMALITSDISIDGVVLEC